MTAALPETPMYDDNELYDVCEPENGWVVGDIGRLGRPGNLILKLRERAMATGTSMQVRGLSSSPVVRYGDDEVTLRPAFSHDPEGMAPEYSACTMSMTDYKKPWLQEALRETGADFVQLSPVTVSDLMAELLGKAFDMDVLGQSNPNMDATALQNLLATAIQHHLGNIFTILGPAGGQGFQLQFVSRDLESGYLANEPGIMAALRENLEKISVELSLKP